MKGKEEMPERRALSGQPEKVEWKPAWEKLKQMWQAAPKEKLRDQSIRLGMAINSVKEGQKLGVPVEEIDQFAIEVISQGTEHQNYSFIHWIRDHLSATHDEKLRALAEKTHQHDLEVGHTGDARNLAKALYGKDSSEFQHVRDVEESEPKKELSVTLSKDATFDDLFGTSENPEWNDVFWQEMHDNFNKEVCDAVLDLQSKTNPAGSTTKILDFFKKRGYSQSDVSVLLPIKFKRERKKK